MNKLASPDCSQCGGVGKVQVPRKAGGGPALGNPAVWPGPREPGFGFTWAECGACGGTGKR